MTCKQWGVVPAISRRPPSHHGDSRGRLALRAGRSMMAAVVGIVAAGWLYADDIEQPDYNRDVRPILSNRCFACHGPDAEHREAELRLDDEEIAKELAIVEGDAQGSELVARIRSEDPDLRMPPPDAGMPLSTDEIETLERWIALGAPYETHWAYVPPQRADRGLEQRPDQRPPDASWSDDRVDSLLHARMRDHDLSPAADADRRSLLRRVTFDLTGLPPTPTEIESFLADNSPLAYSRVVDRLLASPAFGERLASYWLDLVRFADTVGYHGDQDHNISPYRDYVIDSLNGDLSLDQFTREQLAGDLLPNPTLDQQIATGYNRLLQTSHEGGVQPKEYLSIYAADRVRNVSAVWMGATVGCAQCHDHKYDPYTAVDFYSLSAFFADIDEAQHFKVGSNAIPTRRPPEIPVLSHWQRNQLAELQTQIESEKTAGRSAEELEEQKQSLEQQARLTMVTQSIEPREIRVLPRGDWLDDSGPIVEPAVPSFLGSLDVGDRRATRLDLANWLVDAEDGVGLLTARVFVNRVWYLLFGQGLSSSLADFGGQGTPPSHPALLDELALDFVEQGWSFKQLIRRIVLTRAYRLSSRPTADQEARDPTNQWLARQTRFRLPAEMVRDTALSVSGMLVSEVGGSSVKPPQPARYYRHLNFPRRVYVPDRGQGLYRRGVYVHWQRQFLHPMLKAIDAPTREECTAERAQSNTPLESLVMLNDPSMIDAAVALAARMIGVSQSDAMRLESGFELATTRSPSEEETAALQSLLDQEREHFRGDPEAAQSLLDSADRAIDTLAGEPAELAAWTSVARALLNLYETVSRN